MIKSFAKLFFTGAFIVLIASCERRNCDNVICAGNQQCIDGNCACQNGYEGTDCATESYLKYIGSYNVSENCGGTTPNFPSYTVSIIQDFSYVNRIRISPLFNMADCSADIYTDVTTNSGTFINIPYQSQGGLSFSGQGNFNTLNNSFYIDFNYTFNGGSYNCRHTFYKF